MTEFFPSEDEIERLHIVKSYDILDTPPEEAYDRITALVAHVFQVPVAIVSIVDRDRIWFKSRYGLEITEVPGSVGFCASAILQKEPFIIEGIVSDGWALTTPITGWNLDARFYAGAPLTTSDGFNLGTLCLIDTKPRVLTTRELTSLQDFAWLVMQQLELRREAMKTKVKLTNLKSSGENIGLAHKEFASTLVHELRTPLHSILGFAQLLEKEELSASQLSNIQHILQAGWHQAKLIEEFFQLAVRKSGSEPLAQECFPLLDILNECCAMMKPPARMKGIRLTLSSSAEHISVYADRTKLKQVLINLLSNAIKYTPAAGAVTVGWEKSASKRVRISVKDTGIGVQPEKMDQLFEPYNRLGQEAGPEEGMGIGLTVPKKLIEMMGGIIGVESTEDTGSTFWIELLLTEPFALPPT
jgi:signal transduction histidine kinase